MFISTKFLREYSEAHVVEYDRVTTYQEAHAGGVKGETRGSLWVGPGHGEGRGCLSESPVDTRSLQ